MSVGKKAIKRGLLLFFIFLTDIKSEDVKYDEEGNGRVVKVGAENFEIVSEIG